MFTYQGHNVRKKSRMKKSVLVVVAHPDDEVLGCGGTIAKLAREGHEIVVAILGEGVSSRYDKRAAADEELVERLHEESRHVAKLLEIKDLLMYSFPDNRFDTLPLLDIVKLLEKVINELRPEIVLTHHGGDLNIDHAITHRAVLTASRPTEDHPVREIYAFEVLSSTEWAFGQFRTRFNPNVFVDVSKTIKLKIKAMEIYGSEIRQFPHPRSRQALESLARYRGSTVGLEAAEGFELVRTIICN